MHRPFLRRLLSEADALHAQAAGSDAPAASPPARWWRVLRGLIRYFARRFAANNNAALSAALSFRTIFALIPLLVLAFLSAKSLGVLSDSKRSLRSQLDQWGLAQIAASDAEVRSTAPAPVPRADETPELQTPEAPPRASNATGELTVESAPAAADSTSAAAPAGADASAPSSLIPSRVSLADKIVEQVDAVEEKLTFSRLGPIGTLLLIYTALTLLTTIERSLNRILGATESRGLLRRLLLYWSVITLGPIVVAAASFLGDRTVAAFEDALGFGQLLVEVGRFGPIFVGIVALSLVYRLMPCAPVRLGPALFGATAAMLLFQLAKWGFAVYVMRLVVNGNLYGVLGLLPLFLIWINLCWHIFLFGAELVRAATHPEQVTLLDQDEQHVLSAADLLAAVVLVAQRFGKGQGPLPMEDARRALNLPPRSTHWMFDRLAAAGVVCEIRREDAAAFTLARPADQIAVREVLDILDRTDAAGNPRRAAGDNGHANGADAVVSNVARRMRESVGTMTLADVLNAR